MPKTKITKEKVKEVEASLKGSGLEISAPSAWKMQSKIEPLTQEFSHVSEMNILRDKINEIIKQF